MIHFLMFVSDEEHATFILFVLFFKLLPKGEMVADRCDYLAGKDRTLFEFEYS